MLTQKVVELAAKILNVMRDSKRVISKYKSKCEKAQDLAKALEAENATLQRAGGRKEEPQGQAGGDVAGSR